jgi:hypothetical protein
MASFFWFHYFVFRLISRFCSFSLSICFWISSSSILAKAIPLHQFGAQLVIKSEVSEMVSSSSGLLFSILDNFLL